MPHYNFYTVSHKTVSTEKASISPEIMEGKTKTFLSHLKLGPNKDMARASKGRDFIPGRPHFDPCEYTELDHFPLKITIYTPLRRVLSGLSKLFSPYLFILGRRVLICSQGHG